MAAIVYPSTLPGPSVSVVTPAERRLLSDVTGGPQQARGVQRDYLATQRIEWSLLDADEAAAFNAWWRDTLANGGAWFTSIWPAPQGWVGVVRRFIGAPQWAHLPGGFWRITAQVQVRGYGLDPTDCINVRFASVDSFELVSGNVGLFSIVQTPYGPGMQIAAQNSGTEARIRQAITRANLATLSVKFNVSASNSDDAGRFEIQSAGSTTALTLIPRREAAFDFTRRAFVGGASSAQAVSAAGLVVGDWYQFDLIVAGGLHCMLTRLADGAVETTTLGSVSLGSDLVSFSFSADSAGLTCPVIYTDLHLC